MNRTPAVDISFDEDHLPNFHRVSERLYRGGQPSRQGFLHLKQLGVRTILNLRDEHYDVTSEAQLLKQLDLNYVSIPLSPFQRPSDDDIERFLQALAQDLHQPHFVHCLHGQDRTGAMISIHRLHSHGWPLDQAYNEALEHGFHPQFDLLKKAVHDFARHR
jgi:protein tyrosine/serine phosphatase